MADRVTLRLTIDFPGFYLDLDDIGPDDAEDIEEAMRLASDEVVCVFQGTNGRSPGQVLRTLEGKIAEFGWVSRG